MESANPSKEMRLSSIAQLVEQIRSRDSTDTADPRWFRNRANLWFRGQSDSAWDLEPQVMREKFITRAIAREPWMAEMSDGRYAVYEFSRSLFKQLWSRGHHLLHESERLSLTECYFFAQHHGLPTYLLDWTANPLVATFFAVAEDAEKDGALFFLRARHQIGGEESSDINSDRKGVKEFVECLLDPTTLYNLDRRAPYRIMPSMRVGRILQQSARFTLHFPGCKKLTEIGGLVEKFLIPRDAKPQIREELRSLNVDWGTVYPDLPNLIRQLREEARIPSGSK